MGGDGEIGDVRFGNIFGGKEGGKGGRKGGRKGIFVFCFLLVFWV